MRFRLKTDFLTYARDQIRGGIWYKPAWWEAVRKVPPTSFVPRVKKAEIPRITFIEDKLIRDFRGKNPILAQFDSFSSTRNDPRTIASIFAEKQIAAMRDDKSEEEAYGVAKQWLLENGRDTLIRFGVIADEATAAEEAKRRYEQEMAAQTAATRSALREGLRRRQSYRSFMEPEEEEAVGMRALSAEPVLESYSTDGEGAAGSSGRGATGQGASSQEDAGDVLDSLDAQAAVVKGVVKGTSAGRGR